MMGLPGDVESSFPTLSSRRLYYLFMFFVGRDPLARNMPKDRAIRLWATSLRHRFSMLDSFLSFVGNSGPVSFSGRS